MLIPRAELRIHVDGGGVAVRRASSDDNEFLTSVRRQRTECLRSTMFQNQRDGLTKISEALFMRFALTISTGNFRRQTDAVLNALHGTVGKNTGGVFPLDEFKTYFKNRGEAVELQDWHLNDKNLRPIILNVVYCERWGNSPFNVASKGNEPHVDHIYPQYMLRSKMGCDTSEINDIGNLRFVGATDNIRKCAELPDSYFTGLKQSGISIEKHLLVQMYSDKPSELKFEREIFDAFAGSAARKFGAPPRELSIRRSEVPP